MIRIGVSGWRYPGWRGVFYPKALPQRRELEFLARCFDSIELNGSFYSLKNPKLYREWYAATPPGFTFAVKGGRFITHMKKLHEVRKPLANFFASGVLELGEKLGPVLWQLPERLPFDGRIAEFLALLPRTTRDAARLAREHDANVPAFTAPRRASRPIRHAMEVRSPSFCVPAFIELLRAEGVALVIADTAGRFPYLEDLSADFVYVRLHGDTALYASAYSPRAIEHWARRIRTWSRGSEPRDAKRVAKRAPARPGRDVYVYFDNDAEAHAPFDALALKTALGQNRA